MNTTRSEAQWPHDERSDQVHAEQLRDRERVQQDIQGAFDNLLKEHYSYTDEYSAILSESDIKILRWALGVK